MLCYRFQDLLAEKSRRERRRISRAEVAEVTGISVQVLSSLASPERAVVTNTAFLEALCRYFGCTLDELAVFDPPLGEKAATHIDELYPARRQIPPKKKPPTRPSRRD